MSKAATSEFNAPAFQALTPGKFQQVSHTTGAAASSLVFESRDDDEAEDLTAPQTTLIRLFSTTDCWIKIGTNPTAVKVTVGTKGDTFMLRGGIYEYVGVNPGDKLSVISEGTNGTLDILEGQ